MYRETISDRQGIKILILFIGGSTLVLGTGMTAKKDVWLAIILSVVISLPVVLMYARIAFLFHSKDLFDILFLLFGKIMGRIIAALYVGYALHLGALVLRNFGEFIVTVGLPETPQIVNIVVLALLCIWIAKEGIEVIGRWTQLFINALVGMTGLTLVLSIPNYNLERIRPVLAEGFGPVLLGAFGTMTFPFAETVIFTMIFFCFKKPKSAYYVYTKSILYGGLLLLLVSMRNLLVLGESSMMRAYFPSYEAVARIDIGDFLQRIEIVVAISLMIGGFVKISLCIVAASNGIAKIAGFEDYRFLTVPVGLFMINTSYILYENIMEMVDWAFEIYQYYALPFQVFIPILIWITAEVKAHKMKNKREKSS